MSRVTLSPPLSTLCWSNFRLRTSLGACSTGNRPSVGKCLSCGYPKTKSRTLSAQGSSTLTVIPEDQIAEKGVRYVRSIVGETGSKTKWNTFWKYFLKTWTQRFDVTTWNVHEMVRCGVDIVNRTNNPLEKYNRDFASRVGTHPSLLTFIEGTKQEAARYLQRIDDIKKGLQTAPQHAPPVVPGIPAGYADFK
ncbi:hypothetical protein PHYSODRAFT_468181 [Phytophthora sojae]|uniref:Uncharacterized protein n=1 Tax=Phytophthora sojae (strain P6497) TaxID=1094619 RepID=G4YGS6_PHYSP|nr:hypothetical protein PHYSODRAFT_468181 [Phytophthora sojae]EGZ27035.1 hypothetical protein PHYSODRAFT_468181 [Phytophthora sojae]|eukprot:XP_009514310.1 hypothetical protein PHYSODRAFT_468181 [Phytophthora sojae]